VNDLPGYDSRGQVLFDPSSVGLDYLEIQNRASGLRDPIVVDGSRLVVHIQTTEEAVNDLLVLLRDMVEEKKKDGWVKPETMNARVRPRAKAY
jgi:threonine aldolase